MPFIVVFLLFACPYFIVNEKLKDSTKTGFFIAIAVVIVIALLGKFLFS